MNRQWRRILLSLPLLLALCSAGRAPAQQDNGEEWAFQAPRVSSSLLLDVDKLANHVIAVGERGHVLYSTDSGATWHQGAVPTKRMLCAVDIVDEDSAWAAGHNAVILWSGDGGRSWSEIFSAPEEEAPIFDIWFENRDHGIAVGGYGLFLETFDGGANWQRRYLSDEDPHYFAITEAPTGALYVAGEFGTVLRSSDQGQSWQACAESYRGSYFGISALADDSVLVFGLRGNLYRTADQGQSWQKIETGTSAALLGATQNDAGTVLIVGLAGCLLTSDDGGRTFRVFNRPDRAAMAATLALDSRQVLILGEDGLSRRDISSLEQPAAAGEGGSVDVQ